MVHVKNHTNVSHHRYEAFLTDEECSHIAKVFTRYERDVLNIPNPDPTLSYHGLTRQHNVYNWLNHPDIRPLGIPQRLLELELFQNVDHIKVQCWGNLLRQGESIEQHSHCDHTSILDNARSSSPIQPMFASNIFLEGTTPSYTHYEDTGRCANILGEIHLVGGYHEHQVKTNVYRRPRISLAMDIFYDELNDDKKWGFHNKIRFIDAYRSNA